MRTSRSEDWSPPSSSFTTPVPSNTTSRRRLRSPWSGTRSLFALSLVAAWSSSAVRAMSSSSTTAAKGSAAVVAAAARRAAAATALSSTASSSESASESTVQTKRPLRALDGRMDYSWIRQLRPEDEATHPDDNRVKRPVRNGHYVPVTPTPLRNPRLVVHSRNLTDALGLNAEDVESDAFVRFFSGDLRGAFDDDAGDRPLHAWATPYALSIMGQRYTNNCPFGTGEGYGDGRALSVAEIDLSSSSSSGDGDDDDFPAPPPDYPHTRLEFQLKGAGPTPFCRGADGRAVLRSSVREFLASEAMHHLGVETTRALSLVVSDGPNGDTSQRPWYRESVEKTTYELPDVNDPRLALYPMEKRKQIIEQLARQKRDPDVMIQEPNAITCRVSPSFVRVGHLDLFARRLTRREDDGTYDRSTRQWSELELMVRHAGFRDLGLSEEDASARDLATLGDALLAKSAAGVAALVANWIRVGFAQGNFNADNCLVAGRTMDYGPFGFMDRYEPLFAKWTGSGDHFGFMNQPNAAFANYVVLVESVVPVMTVQGTEAEVEKLRNAYIEKAQGVFQKSLDDMWGRKLGFDPAAVAETADLDPTELWAEMESLLRTTKADWTLVWRQLYHVARDFPLSNQNNDDDDALNRMADALDDPSPFYEPLTVETRDQWKTWIASWRRTLRRAYPSDDDDDDNAPAEIMRAANPAYTLREWMLVKAYEAAAKGDDAVVRDLLDLVERPYDDGTPAHRSEYYRRAPDDALTAGGTAFMS